MHVIAHKMHVHVHVHNILSTKESSVRTTRAHIALLFTKTEYKSLGHFVCGRRITLYNKYGKQIFQGHVDISSIDSFLLQLRKANTMPYMQRCKQG